MLGYEILIVDGLQVNILNQESIAEELLTQWIHEERFKNGIGVITGKIWRGRHADNI